MMKEPSNSNPIQVFNIILWSVFGFLIWDSLAPNVIGFYINQDSKYSVYIVLIFATLISVLKWGLVGILELFSNKKIEIPVKYELLFLVVGIPFIIFINNILIWIKNGNQKYEKQNNTTT